MDSTNYIRRSGDTMMGALYLSGSPTDSTEAANKSYVDSAIGGMGAVSWGSIGGTLSNQTDLNTALGTKQATGSYITALTGNVTASGPGSAVATIANSAVTLAKIANIADATILGNNTGGSAAPVALTVSQTKTVLGLDNVANSAQVTNVTGTSPIASSGGTTPAISIANAAADGSTKGAAAFNATNFSASSGVVNTIQGISTAATPQFTRLGLGQATDSSAVMAATGQYFATRVTCTITLDWNNGNVQTITLANSGQTFTFANGKSGGRYLLELKQPASGAAGTVTWPGSVKWSGGTAPTLTATNGQTDIITFYFNGTNYAGGSTLNYGL